MYISFSQEFSYTMPKAGSVECNVCGQRLCNQGTLNVHLRIHTNELPFKCDTCQKRFRGSNDLKSHIQRIHTRKRPYRCEICGSRQFTKQALTVHRKTHLTVKPHSCQFCGKGFCHFGNLRLHIIRHIGEKHFSCDHCSEPFSTGTNKRKHNIRKHREHQSLQEK